MKTFENIDATDAVFRPTTPDGMVGGVGVVGGGLAGCEAALVLARNGVHVTLYEMRPVKETPVHTGGDLAELVCSNSFKSEKPETAAGMLKRELELLDSPLYACAGKSRVDAGGALAVDRKAFSLAVERMVDSSDAISVVREEVGDVGALADRHDVVILATGPLSSDSLAGSLEGLTGEGMFAFYDAAAPIVLADSLDMTRLFRQDRYGDSDAGDYLNAPFDKPGYESFISELRDAKRVIAKDFEQRDLFQACQPIEEIARKGFDAARFGPMKPVGLTDPNTGRRPWAAVQLRAEDRQGQCYNLVGFQTNLTFPEQKRVLRMIPGLEKAEFARYGVMHRNTFVNAPAVLDASLRLTTSAASRLSAPVLISGQLSGTEGYTEAIRSGHHAALSALAILGGIELPLPPVETAFGALLLHATDSQTQGYQPMHVNFGIMKPLHNPPRNKRERYAMYAERGNEAMCRYVEELGRAGLA